ncbi:hypothetical protein HYALB_00011612 [Hymenoscyphus albidus]|uniref:Uncharacterized protein n=1 Tax=Hymenoscyphus albidus TaxID=595503 RepID=A0A9N9LV11_9HELO|nr:hypothetical protein HYALB_00011612 [Hymenoscyphus albidus]
MPPVSTMPFGLDFAFKRGVRSPLIPITLDEEEEKETLKPPKFKALAQEDIKKIKAESVKANTEEFNREPAWNEWKRMEEEAGTVVPSKKTGPYIMNHRVLNATRRWRISVKAAQHSWAAILVDRHGKEYTSVWPCDRRLLSIGLPGYTPKPMGEDDIVLSAANNLHTAWRIAPSKKDETDAKDYPYEEHAWHEDSDQFFWNDKLAKVGTFRAALGSFQFLSLNRIDAD